jgi:hypothetical protein
MWEDFIHWFETDDSAAGYRHLKWDKELNEAKAKAAEGQSSQVRL